MHKQYKKLATSGFTIVELLIVIVVIGILAALALVSYNGITGRSKESAAASSSAQAHRKVLAYAAQNSEQFPAALSDAGVNNGGGTTYQYTRNTTVTPNTYCITATNSGVSNHIATNGKPTRGPCPGHTGTAPTTLDNGGSCPANYILVPGSSLYGTQAFCVMKYEAKNVSGVATSQASGTPWVIINQTTALSTASAACSGCHLITDAEWLTIAQNIVSVSSNWTGSVVGSGSLFIGHSDSSPNNSLAAAADTDPYNGTGNSGSSGANQRRTFTLSNGEVIWDFAGNIWEWTQGTATSLPGSSGLNFREWNATLASSGAILPNTFPTYANASAASWTSTQGLGQLYSDSSDTAQKGLMRGGNWSSGATGGIYSLRLNVAPGSSFTDFGFRVAQ